MARTFTPADKLAAVLREISFRRRAYPRFVAQGTMSQADADWQLAVMQAIAEDYRQQAKPDLFNGTSG